MKILCLSASNTNLKDRSASVRVCHLIRDMLPEAQVNIISLADYDMMPCYLCGECLVDGKCLFDQAFNDIYAAILENDAIFLVVPHYAPIPSKLIMILEKLNEIAYASSLHAPATPVPFQGKPVGIIGHGGMPESPAVLKYYHDRLVTPVADTLRSLSFKVISAGSGYPNGCVFGLPDDHSLIANEKRIFPDIIHDYETIRERIRPLLDNVVKGVTDLTE